MKHIHFVTDDDLFDQKAFGKVKNVCYVFFMNDDEFINYSSNCKL